VITKVASCFQVSINEFQELISAEKSVHIQTSSKNQQFQAMMKISLFNICLII
jgi:hypothetical protein